MKREGRICTLSTQVCAVYDIHAAHLNFLILIKRDWTGSGVGELMSVRSSGSASVLVPSPDTVDSIISV